jgi:NAD(P)-dependent dehydrogenase (short-subunit alcohol dehydrogenase family)
MTTRSVLVTGASTGIGEACALRLARNGWQVFAGVRKTADGERVAAAASASGAASAGGTIVPVSLDITDEHGVDAALDQVGVATGGGLHAVVNNAGVGYGGPVEYLPLDEWRQQFEVNVIGQLAVTRAALPLLRRVGPGARIVFIGSIGGRVSSPLFGPYSASKFALAAIAQALRNELHSSYIKVSVVEPGAIKTEIWGKALSKADELEQQLPAEGRERYRWAIDRTREGFERAQRTGLPADAVAEVVERALTVQRPRPRYLVGREAKLMGTLTRLLPDTTLDTLVRRFG